MLHAGTRGAGVMFGVAAVSLIMRALRREWSGHANFSAWYSYGAILAGVSVFLLSL
jgi:hypothetical protein